MHSHPASILMHIIMFTFFLLNILNMIIFDLVCFSFSFSFCFVLFCFGQKVNFISIKKSQNNTRMRRSKPSKAFTESKRPNGHRISNQGPKHWVNTAKQNKRNEHQRKQQPNRGPYQFLFFIFYFFLFFIFYFFYFSSFPLLFLSSLSLSFFLRSQVLGFDQNRLYNLLKNWPLGYSEWSIK